jgi:RNA polymerase sigma factor (sigma-70 family)
VSNDDSGEGTLEQRALALRKLYYERLARYAVECGGSMHEARAAADDAVMQLASRERHTDLPPVDNEWAWLFIVVRNTIRKALRTRGAEVATDPFELADKFEQVAGSSPERRLEVMEVLRALHAMPEKYRDAVLLAVEGHSRREIAQMLAISEYAATKRVSRGRKLLRKLTGYEQLERTLSRTEEGRPE